ncbi:MAG: cytochrome P450 [Rubricella sp.]
MIPPKPPSRPDDAGLIERIRRFRGDVFASQPARLYRAWMAEQRTPFYRSFLVNDPALVREVLQDRSGAFPKSILLRGALKPLLGRSVFVTNGAEWERQRRIIDPAFEGGRLKETFPAIHAAAESFTARLDAGSVEIEEHASRFAADAIFRALFSRPIGEDEADRTYRAFRAFQRSQPILSLLDIARAPLWLPRPGRRARREAEAIRALIGSLVDSRRQEIAARSAPDDLATRIMSTPDPETGAVFTREEMVDQVAIFFLAGHETSASTLSWALWLLAAHPEVQSICAAEAGRLPETVTMPDLARLPTIRDVVQETLRLYPPVPMLLREAAVERTWRKRRVPKGSMVIVSPWHLHRHERIWPDPDAFRPARWRDPDQDDPRRTAFIPFSAGPRICPGAGFAQVEIALALAHVLRRFSLAIDPAHMPVPVAHLTVRARDGIYLTLARRD